MVIEIGQNCEVGPDVNDPAFALWLTGGPAIEEVEVEVGADLIDRVRIAGSLLPLSHAIEASHGCDGIRSI